MNKHLHSKSVLVVADVYVGTFTKAIQDTVVCCQGWSTNSELHGIRSQLSCSQVGPFNWYCLLERADWAA